MTALICRLGHRVLFDVAAPKPPCCPRCGQVWRNMRAVG